MYGKGITDDGGYLDRALSVMREFMEDDGQSFVYQKFIAPANETVTFAKGLNRSVTGSINELVRLAQHYLIEGEISPHDVGFRLNDVLLSALGTEEAEWGKPSEAFKLLANDLAGEKGIDE